MYSSFLFSENENVSGSLGGWGELSVRGALSWGSGTTEIVWADLTNIYIF
jgi:hypothetical protein